MSNKIPPLLSHTPPPIDFDDNEKYDDFRGFESSDIYDFGEISLPETPVKQQKILEVDESCPLPIVPILPVTPISDIGETLTTLPGTPDIVKFDEIPTVDNIDEDNDDKLPKINEKKTEENEIIENLQINNIVKEIDKVYVEDLNDDDNENEFNYRGESPPSLILSQDNFSDNDFNNDDDIDELDNEVAVNFNKFNYNENDNNSIPSLKLDSNNDSKCVTPQSINDNSLTTSITAITPIPVAIVEAKPEEVEENPLEDNNNLNILITDETISVDKTINSDNIIGHTDDIDNDFNDDDFDNISSFDTMPTFTANDNTSLNYFANNDIEEEINWNDDSDKNDNDDMFIADFSQFNDNVIENQEIIIENTNFVNKINNLNNENLATDVDDDDDDFDDFVESNECPVAVNEDVILSSATIAPTTSDNNNKYDNDFDDDFDDFQKNEIIIEPTLNTFKTIIEKVFLLNDVNNFINKNDENNNNDSDSDNNCNKLNLNNNNNNLLITIKDFDGAKALNYQWLNSSSNQTLITSLGIDSRNILYGTRWNSSMPRFAANLGFSPLEPIKPSTIPSTSNNVMEKSIKQQEIQMPALTTTTTTMSHPLSPIVTSSTQSFCDNNNPMVVSHSTNNLQMASTDVPAAQFDWNSSGLVNPLDDVQEFLNKAGTAEIKQSRKEIINENEHNDDRRTETSKIISITNSPTKVTATSAAAAATAINFSTPTSLSLQQEFTTQLNNENNFNTNLPSMSFVSGGGGGGGAVSGGNGTIDLKSTGVITSVLAPTTTIQQSNPCNKTTLRETHIFTPNKGTSPISRELNDNNLNINDDQTSSIGVYNNRDDKKGGQPSTILIDKKVIIKEYRDVEYNPDKLINNAININDKINSEVTGGGHNNDVNIDDDDDFTEFKNYPTISVNVPKQQTILQPTIINNNINWPEPGYNNINFNLNNNNNNECNLEEGLANYKLNKMKKETEMKSKELDKNKSNDVDSDGDKIILKTENNTTFNDYQKSVDTISNDDEFSDFQFVPTVPVQQTIIPPVVDTTMNKTLYTATSVQQQPQSIVAPIGITDKILIPTQQQQQQPPALQQQSRAFNCPILEPTTMNFEQKSDNKTNDISLTLNGSESVFEPKINWGNTSNINPDELARIEAIFPKQTVAKQLSASSNDDKQKIVNNKSNKDDVEWSDFVSVDDVSIKMPTNSNNNNNSSIVEKRSPSSSANKVSNSIDDDGWNDFVSIPPNLNQNTQQQQWNLQYNLNQGPKFTSWNAPSSSSTQEINHSWNFNKQQPLSPLNFNSNKNNNQINQLPMLKQFNQMSSGNFGSTVPSSATVTAPTVVSGGTGVPVTMTQTIKPSISLIPDLGFAVPKMFNLSNQQQHHHHHQQQKYQQFNYHNNHNIKK